MTPRPTPRPTCVALVQLAVEDGAPAANLARAGRIVRGAPAADLYLLPELWTTGYAHAGWDDAADQHAAATLDAMREWARARRAWVGGSIVDRRDDGALANRFWLVAPGGDATHYDKAHLFAPLDEPRWLSAGDRRVVVEVAGVPAALSVCFDLRFPEMYRLDALDGAMLFLVASAWPAARAEAMRLFARARAAENQAVLVLCNRAGAGADGLRFAGGSCVVGPDGVVLGDAGTGEGVTVVEVDLARAAALRASFPVLPLRREGVDTDAMVTSRA